MSADQGQLESLVINASVRVERDAALGWIVLSRPGQINAINDEIRQGVPQALELLERDPRVRVILIRGEGERGFCAGADIKENVARNRPSRYASAWSARAGSRRWTPWPSR